MLLQFGATALRREDAFHFYAAISAELDAINTPICSADLIL